MIVPEPFESPESGREGYFCAYEIYFKGCGLFFPLPEILLTYLNHLGVAFSQMSPNMLRYLLCTFTVAAEAGYSLGLYELLELFQARKSQTSGYYALYPIADRNLIDGLPLKDNAWRKFWFFFRINNFSTQSSSELLRIHWSSNLGPQIRPIPSVDFLNFYKDVVKRPVNWNSFTLERIHGAGFCVRMGLTNLVDPPPAGIDLSIDDGSLEGSKSMTVAVNNAPPSTPAADTVVAATAEEEGVTGDSSLIKKRKAEELEPPLEGCPRNTRKGKAAPSNPSIPGYAEAQDVNPDSGIVLKEPLGSGRLPPRRPRGNTSRARSYPSPGLVARASSQSDKEKIGNTFRCFHTRSGKKLPSFEWWKPEIKNMYISHSFNSSQRLDTALADHNLAKSEIELLRSELDRVKTAAEELERKNQSLSELNDRDVRKLSHNAQKEVKGAGQKFLLAVQEFITTHKAWNKLSSERDEMKSNLDLIKEIEEGSVNLAEEKETVGAELAETEAKLANAPQPYLDLQQFASEFADSPPLTEPNIGLSLDEMMLTGSHRAHFNEFGTNVDKISLERTQGFSGKDHATSSIMEDDSELRSETPQDASSLIPEVVFETQDATAWGAPISCQVGDEGGSPMNE
ncbi:hypothetical protein ISN44_As10g009020 [Arabidopsis suecica]|uniref:Uncharacterized protein n=1 Tax=Arabidopsis suecica TaxID=45249 RepID=A0A8T1ZTJ6_ARASU|nr:hypothetical protein ISN44_As10g009020 [Arabidopsis suecica]